MLARHADRKVVVDGIENFRDVGGLGMMTRGLVYRCGKTLDVTKKGRQRLQALGVRHAIDFRHKLEIDKYGLADLTDIGCVRIHAPTMDLDMIPLLANGRPWGTLELGYVALYLHLLDEGTPCFRTVIKRLLQSKGEPCLFHCTSGKDRTGVMSMLLQLVAEVPEHLIVEDYAISDTELGDHVEHIKKNKPPGGIFDGLNDTEMANLAGAKAETMILVLDVFKRQWGSVENYCTSEKGLALSITEFYELRALLTGGHARSAL
jgi:hypothetical protein